MNVFEGYPAPSRASCPRSRTCPPIRGDAAGRVASTDRTARRQCEGRRIWLAVQAYRWDSAVALGCFDTGGISLSSSARILRFALRRSFFLRGRLAPPNGVLFAFRYQNLTRNNNGTSSMRMTGVFLMRMKLCSHSGVSEEYVE